MTKTKDIFQKLNKDIRKVAVTVDPDGSLLAQIEEAGFDVLQVHKRLRPEVLQKTSLPIWYAINLSLKEAENDVAWKEAERLAQEVKVKAFFVDVSSGVEGTDGKSREKILQFVSKVKNN